MHDEIGGEMSNLGRGVCREWVVNDVDNMKSNWDEAEDLGE